MSFITIIYIIKVKYVHLKRTTYTFLYQVGHGTNFGTINGFPPINPIQYILISKKILLLPIRYEIMQSLKMLTCLLISSQSDCKRFLKQSERCESMQSQLLICELILFFYKRSVEFSKGHSTKKKQNNAITICWVAYWLRLEIWLIQRSSIDSTNNAITDVVFADLFIDLVSYKMDNKINISV